jgi:hypothetical protein
VSAGAIAADDATKLTPAEARTATAAPGASRYSPGEVLLDRYRIVRLLGRGGMGEVYLVDDLHLDHQVALKFLIDRFLRAERAAAPALFDQRLLMKHQGTLRASLPGLSNVALAEVTDADAWMRAHITYDAAPDVQEKSVRTTGQLVIYYHSSGMAVLGAVCSADDNACQRLGGLLTDAEQALRRRLGSSDLGGVLSESDCSTEAIQLPNIDQYSDVRVCAYGSGIRLTLTRLGSAATIESLVAERRARP